MTTMACATNPQGGNPPGTYRGASRFSLRETPRLPPRCLALEYGVPAQRHPVVNLTAKVSAHKKFSATRHHTDRLVNHLLGKSIWDVHHEHDS